MLPRISDDACHQTVQLSTQEAFSGADCKSGFVAVASTLKDRKKERERERERERGDESGRASTWKARKVNWKSFLLQKATKTYFTAKHSRCSSCCFHLMSFPWAGVKIEDVFGILKRVVLAQGHSVETIFSVPLNLKPPSLVQKFLLKPLFCKNIDTS